MIFAVGSNSIYDPFTVNWDKCIFLYSLHYREEALYLQVTRGSALKSMLPVKTFLKDLSFCRSHGSMTWILYLTHITCIVHTTS